MREPGSPANEAQRLAALRALRILDTGPEDRFDRHTRLARALFDVPIALISLVDGERQWFKSKQGLEANETPRSISFCGHTILERSLTVVEDARLDLRFADNPLVSGPPHIRFYAGAPLNIGNDLRIGTLCIIDQQPRALNEEQRQCLSDLASVVVDELRAFVDELTALSNLRGFHEMTERSLSLCQRNRWPAALLIIDLNGFKRINDRYGHDAGDRALAKFGRLLQESFRRSDVIGRLGGDEFGVFLPNATAAEATDCIDRLSAAVTAVNRETESGYRLAFSSGMCMIDPTDPNKLSEILHEADQRMYAAKRNQAAAQ